MQFRKLYIFPFFLIVAIALFLSACQAPQPAKTDAATATIAPEPSDSTPVATQEAFQEVNDPSMGKTVLPPEMPAGATLAERPHSTLGADDATLTMYEWCDYSYPNCVVYANDILPELQKKYVDNGKLRIVHKEFPAAGGDPSVIASLAAQCAGRQDHYQDMSKWLYRDTSWNTGVFTGTMDAMKTAATDMGLDSDAFNACMDNQETLEDVKQDYFEARDLEFHDLPGVVIDGRLIQDGVVAQDLENVIDALLQQKESGSLPDTVVTVTPSPTPDTDFEPETVAIMGSPDAKVVIVEFTDFQCPFCQRYTLETMPKIKQDYIDTGKVQYVLKNFPLTQIHPQAVPAAEAAECAGEQGKYWEMHDKLFGDQQQWAGNTDAATVFQSFAKDLGLDEKAFNECVTSGRYQEKIMSDLQEGVAAGVTGTPAFFVNGQFISGAQPYQVFQQIIEQALAGQ